MIQVVSFMFSKDMYFNNKIIADVRHASMKIASIAKKIKNKIHNLRYLVFYLYMYFYLQSPNQAFECLFESLSQSVQIQGFRALNVASVLFDQEQKKHPKTTKQLTKTKA